MENIEIQNNKEKKPLVVRVIAILIMVPSGFKLLQAFFILLSFLVPGNFTKQIFVGQYWNIVLSLVIELIVFISAIGLWKMKKWSFYLLIIGFIFSSVSSFWFINIVGGGFDIRHLAVIFQMAILIYLWTIRKKFK